MCNNKLFKQQLEIGVPTHLRGFDMLVDALTIVVETDGKVLHGGITTMYDTVGQKYDISGSAVERNIRQTVEKMFYECDTDVLEKYLGNTINVHKGKVTNAAFISTLYKWYKYEKELTA